MAHVEEREWRQREQLEGLRAAWAGAVPGMGWCMWYGLGWKEKKAERRISLAEYVQTKLLA